jgi:hypothetical protein
MRMAPALDAALDAIQKLRAPQNALQQAANVGGYSGLTYTVNTASPLATSYTASSLTSTGSGL